MLNDKKLHEYRSNLVKCHKKMESHTIQGRDSFIDFVRGVAIFLVLWGHSIQYFSYDTFDYFADRMFAYIYSFHMPLFMCLSGYVFYWMCGQLPLKNIIVMRIKRLGIPIVAWGVLWLGIRGLVNGKITWDMIWGSFTEYWFLWSVLACSVAVSVIYKVEVNNYL